MEQEKSPRPSEVLREKIYELESNSYFTNPPENLRFNEYDYSEFDSDAVRPQHVEINEKLRGTAIVREKDVFPSTLPENDIFHRAALHSGKSLPPFDEEKHASVAADQLREKNPETAKIFNSEHLTREMKRSDDAIAYFARTPDKATVKLVFCKPISTQVDVDYNPYNLQVVTKEDTELLPVYYTISQNGVMRIVNDEAAKKVDYRSEMRALRVEYEESRAAELADRPKIIYKQPSDNDDCDIPESFLAKRQPEEMNQYYLSNRINPLKPFLEDSTEFVELSRWILESSSFKILRNFKFFREFYARKSLENWIAFRKYRKFCRNRAFEQFNLFTAKPHFLVCLEQINTTLVKLRDSLIIDPFATFEFDVDGISKKSTQATPTNSLKAWTDAQARLQSHVSGLMENANESMLNAILTLCAELHQRASDRTDEENAKLPLFLREKMLKSKSITQTKAEQLEKRRAVRTAENELCSVYRLVQLADQEFLEALLQMLQASCDQLATSLHSNKEIRPGTSGGLVQSEIGFDSENRLFFEPSLQTIQESIEGAILNSINLCNKPSQLSRFESLKEYFILGKAEQRFAPQTIVQIASGDAELQGLITEIERHTYEQISQLTDRAGDYQELEVLHSFLAFFDETEYIKQESCLSCSVQDLVPADVYTYIQDPKEAPSAEVRDSVDSALEAARAAYGTRPLEREIAKFRSWEARLGKQAPAVASGFAQLDARALLQKLQPVPLTGLKAVENTCLSVLHTIYKSAGEKIEAHTKAISQEPSELEAYSAFITYLGTVDVDLENLVQKVQLCDDVMQLLTSENLVQTQVPQCLWNVYGRQQSLDEMYVADAKINPQIAGLGLKINIEDRSDLESLHTNLQVLEQRRNQAEGFAQQVYQSQVNNMVTKLEVIKKSTGDVNQELVSGPSSDQNAEPTQVILNLKELSQKVDELEIDTNELAGHSGVINNWLDASERRRRKADKPGEQRTNPMAENLDTALQRIKGFSAELKTRLELWQRLNEWKIFEEYILYDPWISICLVGQKSDDFESEEQAEEQAEIKADQPTNPDQPTESDEPDEQLQLLMRFKSMNVEACMGYVSEALKDANKFTRQLNQDPVSMYYKQIVTQMRHKSQLLMDLGNTAMDDMHWQELFDLVDGQQFSYTSQFTLFSLMKAGILSKKGEIQQISARATGENNLKKQVEEIQSEWNGTKFICKEYAARSNANSLILSGVDDIYQLLDDSLALVQSMASSRYVAGIRDRVGGLEQQLAGFSDILDEWVRCQQAWLYLESIFAPQDIKNQLPVENEMFQEVDKFWHELLYIAEESKSVLDFVADDFKVPGSSESLLITIEEHNESLEKIQKRLEDYLETKRLAFPRFYFISNDELLQILARTTEIGAVRPFLRKIFEALADFTISEENEQAQLTEMISPEGEVVGFEAPVIPEGGLVEAWLGALEAQMFNTLRIKQMKAVREAPAYGESRKAWIFEHPAQCVLAAGQVVFVNAAEGALYADNASGGRAGMHRVQETMVQQIEELSEMIIATKVPIERKIITPLIVIEVFSRDVCSALLDKTSDNYSTQPSDFGWEKQLRHYWVPEEPSNGSQKFANTGVTEENIATGNLVFKETDFTFISGYEYYGVNNRLVVTPLTTKCYLTLTSAISRGFGGNPLGPAGTGKTETCKDLIKTLQVSCLIFNCSDGLDHKSMAKFFCGLAMSGSFSVFDEFNRILIDTLSVISQQILTIQNAVRAKKTVFAFEQHAELKLNCRVGFFITFNPDYGGRTELPESVKALFRPIAMIVPDYALIAENFLFSEGYKNGKVLSRKMTELYKLSSEQLSQQFHYDFGMRAIKSILYMAGRLKADSKSNESEDNLLIRAMLDSNIPKFLADDIDLFNGIVQDLFPGLQMPATDYGVLEAEIRSCLQQRGLQANKEFVIKILQAYDTHIIRHGEMFVGETLTGKTVAREVLAEAITNLAGTEPEFLPVEEHLLSAKSITMAELYGELSRTTNEWTDGLIAIMARRILTEEGIKHFIVFDSPVDPIWIENLNTVLDDSKMFCLSNGERIRLNDLSNIMVEVADLSQASPATVSRCGMVYFSQKFLSIEGIFRSLTVDSISFMRSLLDLVILEEFNLDLQQLREEAEDLIVKKVFDDEIETPAPQQEVEEKDRLGQALLGTYPVELCNFAFFEEVGLHMAVSVAEKIFKQFTAIFVPLIKKYRQSFEEDLQTTDFEQVKSVIKVFEALIAERIAFSREKLSDEASKAAKLAKEQIDAGTEQAEQLSAEEEFSREIPLKEELDERNTTGLAPITSILLDERLVFAITWGLGGNLKFEYETEFDKTIRELAKADRAGLTQEQSAALMSLNNNMPPVSAVGRQDVLNVFDWKIDNSTRYYAEWSAQNKMFGSDKFNEDILMQGGSVYDMIVPTTQFIKICTLLQSLLRNNSSVYLCGSTGTSKTSIVKTVFGRTIGAEQKEEKEEKKEGEEEQQMIIEVKVDCTEESSPLDASVQEIPFSAQTKALAVENAIFEKLDKKRKNLFAAANGRLQHYIFVDDADMPAYDKFGAQPPNELIRQLMFESGCYDRQKLSFKQVEGLQFIYASEQPGAGRNYVDSRLTSKFVCISCPEVSVEAMNYIFGSLLDGFLQTKIGTQEFAEELRSVAKIAVASLVDLYNGVRAEIRATPLKAHYTFNLRDVARVIGGIFSVRPEELRNIGDMVAILVHESERVFRDRLVDIEDEQIFDELLGKTLVSYFKPYYDKTQRLEEKEENEQENESEAEEEETESIMEKADAVEYGPTIKEWMSELESIAKCELNAQTLMYGRWTNQSGVTPDVAPYKNLNNIDSEKKNALTNILNSVYDEDQEDHQAEIDYDLLLNQEDEQQEIRLVLFKDAISHFSRMFRVFSQPAGHILCIGLSGSGRKSLLRLVATQLEAIIVEPTASKFYGLAELYEDLKRCFLTTADEGDKFKSIILLLTETSLDEADAFLEIINGVINGVPLPISVWKKEEVERVKEIAEIVGAKMETEGEEKKKDYTTSELWDLFYRTARANFHIALCFSPIGEKLRRRLREFPALVNCTTIDWYTVWDNEALLEVAESFLSQVHPVLLDKYPIDILAKTCVLVHDASSEYATGYFAKTKEQIYVTPPMFISFLQLFKSILQKSVGGLKERHTILSKGLTKLTDTSSEVEGMKAELKELQPVLAESVEATEQLLEKLSVDEKTANEIRENVEKEGKEVAKMVASAQEIKDDVAADLEEAMPAYLSAMKALQNFDKNSVVELKSFKEPPIAVKETLEAVCVLFETPKTDWDTALRLVSEMNFLSRVMNFDKDCIKPKTLRVLRKYTQNPDFTIDKVENSSKAAKCLFEWCEAMDVYAKVAAEVQPKREKLASAEAELKKQQDAFEIKEQELADVQAKLAALQQEYDESVHKRTTLENQIKDTELRLGRAEKLVNGLSSEHESWKIQIEEISEDLKSSVGDALLASVIIAYLGPYTSDERTKIISDWKKSIFSTEIESPDKIYVSEKFSLDTYSATADPREIRQWKQKCQLPGDSGSIQSAIIVTSSKRYPFLIDPELQGLNWLKKMLSKHKLVGANIETMARDLENSITTGQSFIVENVTNELDATLSSVLRKEIARNYIKVGDKTLPYNNQFGLYLASRERKIDLSPDIQASGSVINMSVSSEGLEEELLSLVLQVEDPESELARDEAAGKLADAKDEEQREQDIVLNMLANATGNILDDEALINALQQSKEVTERIIATIQECEITTKNSNEKREFYREVAVRGRILYEAVAGLSALDPMYTYSIDFFKNLFTKTLEQLPRGDDKIQRMITAVTETIFTSVCRGIFERHKPVFAFMIASGIQRDAGAFSQKLWELFTNDNLFKEVRQDDVEDILYETLQADLSLCQINFLSQFSIISGFHTNLVDLLEQRAHEFVEFCEYETTETYQTYEFADEAVLKLLSEMTAFERLVFCKILNPKRLLFYLPMYTLNVMNSRLYIEPPNFLMQDAFQDCSNTVPLIFILSAGSDPMMIIQEYVHSEQKTHKFYTLALGEGQGVIADQYIERAAINGEWVCLQNCHLCESWMPNLQRHVEKLRDLEIAGSLHPDFRLIMTSMPSKAFPSSVLAEAIKVSNEPPRGVKENMLMAYEVMNETYHDEFELPELQKHWQRSIFALSFFYALLLERRRFGPICYNSKYDFTIEDLQISQKFVSQYMIDAFNVSFKGQASVPFEKITEIIPYKPLSYMIGNIAFGGRISDALDTRCVDTIMGQLLNNELFNSGKRMCNENDDYVAPDCQLSYNEVIKYIEEQFPIVEPTSLFSLHANAELAYQATESHNILEAVLLMKPADVGAEGQTVEMVDEKVLRGADEILQKIPADLDLSCIVMPARIRLTSGQDMPSPLTAVLRQECARYNRLLRILRQLFNEVELAIRGLAIMSADLDEIYSGILSNKLPKVIKTASYPTLKSLAAYIDDLARRVEFFRAWTALCPADNSVAKDFHIGNYSKEIQRTVYGELDGFLPTQFWLGAFYFPHGFFTGILQHHARVYALSIDRLAFQTVVLNDEEAVSNLTERLFDGNIITGLKAEGCQWDRQTKTLNESTLGQILANLPPIWFRPVVQLEVNNMYALPLYTTTNRFGVLTTTGLSSNYVMNMHLPSEKPQSWWIMRGAAAFIQDVQ